MGGDIVYRIYGRHRGRKHGSFFGAFRTRTEAEAEVERLLARTMNSQNWASRYHDQGFEIRPVAVETDFEIPPRPTPREKYETQVSRTNPPGTWETIHVEVLCRSLPNADPVRVCGYDRDFGMMRTFEPFRQGGREFALISSDYAKTTVLDLATGNVIAEERSDDQFCPVGFYVPDWWDVHDGSVIPGSEYWTEDREWPSGLFGFVWGCHWGDDNSWKVQYLDLSRIHEGIILRDERFGYLELAPSAPIPPGKPPPFIRVSKRRGQLRVAFDVEMTFDVASGNCEEWQRLKISDLD